jgi:hypothetical protein
LGTDTNSDIDSLFDEVDRPVENAGGGTVLPLGAITEEYYESIFGSNVKGVHSRKPKLSTKGIQTLRLADFYPNEHTVTSPHPPSLPPNTPQRRPRRLNNPRSPDNIRLPPTPPHNLHPNRQ